MCQICAIKELAAKERWPKPVEALKTDLNFLVEATHDEVEKYKAQKQKQPTASPSDPLLDLLRTLSEQLDVLEAEREKWWTSPEKRQLRRRLDEDCDQRKLSELHKINNATVSSIETLVARLGQFVKWTLGMNGGIWELMHCSKVAKA